MGAKDFNNEDDVTAAKAWSFLAVVVELLSYIFISAFSWNLKRKRLFLISEILYLCASLSVFFGNLFDSFFIIRLLNVFHGIGAASCFSSAYFLISDLVPSSLQFVGSATLALFSTATTFSAPLFLKEGLSDSRWTLYFGIYSIIVAVAIVVTCFYIIETEGLSKPQIYDKLRGTKTVKVLSAFNGLIKKSKQLANDNGA
jgi:MFS family permease